MENGNKDKIFKSSKFRLKKKLSKNWKQDRMSKALLSGVYKIKYTSIKDKQTLGLQVLQVQISLLLPEVS